MKTLAKIKGYGTIVEEISDLYTELLKLSKANACLVSPRDEAYIRIKTKGKKNIGKEYGTRTSTGFEYAKGESPILNLKSRLTDFDLAKLAVEANRAGNYFHTDSAKEYESSLVQAEKDKDKEPAERNVIVLPSRDKFTMFNKEHWDIYQAILKDQAEPFFELNGPITVYPVDAKIVDAQGGTILTALWFSSLDVGSDFFGYGGCLLGDLGARGVIKIGAEGASRKSFSGPDLTDILEYSRPFVPEIARAEFEKGLKAKYKKQ